MPRSTLYRKLQAPKIAGTRKKTKPRRALSAEERKLVLDVLHAPRFIDKPPAQVYAALLDEGVYLCSIRTMYRLLRENQEVRERRNQRRHPQYKKPELLATGPNQVWSWDITKLRGPYKWTSYFLYVIMDIFSRKVVGWMVATRECGELAADLIAETCLRQRVEKHKLCIHSDRGSPMKSKSVARLLEELGVHKSFSRPHVSDDNPYSESQFKTLKYHPQFPDRFGSIQDARAFCGPFFNEYNEERYHSGIALMTPEVVHSGKAAICNTKRQAVLTAAYKRLPERFVNGAPIALQVPAEVWINKPKEEKTEAENELPNLTIFSVELSVV